MLGPAVKVRKLRHNGAQGIGQLGTLLVFESAVFQVNGTWQFHA
jgi:hypothetical protein